MQKKSFTFGLGFGIIVFSIIFYVTHLIETPKVIEKTLTDAEVMAKAKSLGMLTVEEATATYTKAPILEKLTDEQIMERASELGMVFVDPTEYAQLAEPASKSEPVPTIPPSETKYKQFVQIQIDGGVSAFRIASLLKENGVVDDAKKFQEFLIQERATTLLRAGALVFPVNADYDDVLQVLQKKIKYKM